MSTDLIRRCDCCKQIIPDGRPVALVTASIDAARLVSVERQDTCSEPCAIALVRRLYAEATAPVGVVADVVAG